MSKHPRKRIRHIEAKEFIEAYIKSDYNWQVAEKFGVDVIYVNGRAANLRKSGVKLPPRYPKLDTDDLNAFIESLGIES